MMALSPPLGNADLRTDDRNEADHFAYCVKQQIPVGGIIERSVSITKESQLA
jgi:hypothetical protein